MSDNGLVQKDDVVSVDRRESVERSYSSKKEQYWMRLRTVDGAVKELACGDGTDSWGLNLSLSFLHRLHLMSGEILEKVRLDQELDKARNEAIEAHKNGHEDDQPNTSA